MNPALHAYRQTSAQTKSLESTIVAGVLVAAGLWMAFRLELDDRALATFGVCASIGFCLRHLAGPCLSIANLTLPGVFLAAYFVLMSLSSAIIYSEMAHWVRGTYFLAVQSVLITFPAGVLLANGLASRPRQQAARYGQQPLHATPKDAAFAQVVSYVFWAAVGVSAIYVASSEHIPILKLFFDMSSQIDDLSLRFAASESSKPLLLAFALSRSLALPLCVLYFYFMGRAGVPGAMGSFYRTFAAALAINAITLERGPTIVLCAMVLFGMAITNLRSALSPRMLLRYGLMLTVGLGLAGLISAFQYSSEVTFADVVDNVEHVFFNRILLASANACSLAFMEFPGPDHLHGQYVRMFSVLTGGEYLESRYAPKLVILPVSFVGDLWRNWGWPAVIIGGVVLGFVYQQIQLLVFHHKTVLTAVFQAILILACMWLIPGNAFGILTTSMLVIATGLGFVLSRYSTNYRRVVASPRGGSRQRPVPARAA